MSKEDEVLVNSILGNQPKVIAVYACPIEDFNYDNVVIEEGKDIVISKQEPESTKLVIDDFELKVKSAYTLFKNNLISKDEYIIIMDTIFNGKQ